MTLSDALNRIRAIEHSELTFGLVFITQTPPSQFRHVARARLRPAPTNHKNHDAYLYFTDLDKNLPRQCRKRLITKVYFSAEWNDIEI